MLTQCNEIRVSKSDKHSPVRLCLIAKVNIKIALSAIEIGAPLYNGSELLSFGLPLLSFFSKLSPASSFTAKSSSTSNYTEFSFD